MSFLARTLRSSRALSRAPYYPSRALVSFHTSSASRAMGERDLGSKHEDTDDLAQRRENEKQDNLPKQGEKEGKDKEALASNSEENISGDKTDKSMKEMEKMGEQKGKEENKGS